jgi:NADH dehydrogenase (ubiquinone) 1 alpha subcomplex subunit 6
MDAWGAFVPYSLPFSFPSLNFLAHNALPQAPEICTLYSLDVPPSAVRAVIRQRFEKNRYVSDPKVIDILIHKSRQEYQEAVNFWKQEPHVLGPFLSNRDRPHRTFMQKFLEGGSSHSARFSSPSLRC